MNICFPFWFVFRRLSQSKVFLDFSVSALCADSTLVCLLRALWFVLEIIMAKNENNSHAFIRKMVENMKQTKDAQAATDPKSNEVRDIYVNPTSLNMY